MGFIRENTDAVAMWGLSSNDPQALYKQSNRYEEDNYHVEKLSIRTPRRTLTQTCKWTDAIMTTWTVEHLCKDTADVDAFMELPWEPVRYTAEDYPRIREEIGEGGIIMASIPDPACWAMEIMEFGEATVWALTETDHFKATLEEIHRRFMINLKNQLEVQPVDLYRICGPEYITPPYLPPSYFERFVLPYVSDMVALIHQYGSKARIHSHGKIGRVLDMIIDSGADALDPCEAPPDGDIELGAVKKKAAGKMTLFGNLQLKLLERGSPAAVEQEVRRCMAAAKEGGGYIIMPTAAPINLPLSPATEENYRVFINTALECGAY
jgi:uroporphyrinogen-III decarboxylase